MAGFVALLLFLVVASAFADDPSAQRPGLPSSDEVIEAIEAGNSSSLQAQLTDPAAAERLPKEDLSRSEAAELLSEVFEAPLQAPVGIFDDLDVEKFLTSNVAVASAENSGSASHEGSDVASEESSEDPGQIADAVLVDSSVPLRTEGPSGEPEAVDLGLEMRQGQLQPANPLVDLSIPLQLGEGIELPDAGVTIKVAGAPEDRSPSIVDESIAFLPNIAVDTDFAVVPTPTGLETFTQLRSADSPRSQTFQLELPSGARLEATSDGGAIVARGNEELVGISRPIAIDAAGADVPVSLSVDGSTFTLKVSPDSSAQFPILVDPLIHTYQWANMNSWQSGICNSSHKFTNSNSCNNREEWGYEHYDQKAPPFSINLDNHYPGWNGATGLWIAAAGSITSGDRGAMVYTVPRYFTQTEPPTSFISHMTLSNVKWSANSPNPSPHLYMGLWDILNKGFVSYYTQQGLSGSSLNDTSYQYQFPNSSSNTNAKVAAVIVQANETQPYTSASVFVGSAAIHLADNGSPNLGSLAGPTKWVNQTPLPINFTAEDTGLGVHSLNASAVAGQLSWDTQAGCIGVAGSACSRIWSSTDTGKPALKYDPSVMPTGLNYVAVKASDPVGNSSTPVSAQVKVDHVAPQLALSGSITEQDHLGLQWPSYVLKVDASDGSTPSPQSGAAKIVIKVDGAVVDQIAPGCTTQNCAISREWTLESSKFSDGKHTVEAIVTDAVGISSEKELEIELDNSQPDLALSGTLTEQEEIGASRPRYRLAVNASALAGLVVPSMDVFPYFTASFGSGGTGNAQFDGPAAAAIAPDGDIWVADSYSNRIQHFDSSGNYISNFGSSGEGNGQFNRPRGIEFDSAGNIWVLDSANHRLQKFNEAGEYLGKWGTNGSGNGQLKTPKAFAIDEDGNFWVADTVNARIQKFSANGTFLKVAGTSGPGDLTEPMGIDTSPEGDVFVADWDQNRVVVFDSEGVYERSFGTEGDNDGEFNHPGGLHIGSQGYVWVADSDNNRIQQFDIQGSYITQFGSYGTGEGEMDLTSPVGIVTDVKGAVWVTDSGNDRMQLWEFAEEPKQAVQPASFGSGGTGNGQFDRPGAIAIAPNGDIWVADSFNHRIQHFDSNGNYIGQFGSAGTDNGQFDRPRGIEFDAAGSIWVLDSANHRLQKFNDKGEYLTKWGTNGSGNGQLKTPKAFAIDDEGNFWVADTVNGRIQKFSLSGTFLKVAGTSGPGDLTEPIGIDTSPEGEVFVADWAQNRVVVFDSAGEYERAFGAEGDDDGEFNHPGGVNIDTQGNVFVGDSDNHRIQQFDSQGEYIAQFGSEGSGQGEMDLSSPIGIRANAQGLIWVANAGNDRVQQWQFPRHLQSEISTEILIDGQKVDGEHAVCVSEQCVVAHDWLLESSAYSAGGHALLVKAEDSLGNTMTKSLAFEIQPDTSKPTLQISGDLADAPEGWVEQDEYDIDITATDPGRGVTSLVFSIDGGQLASANSECVEGGCDANVSKQIDMDSYLGGSHSAKVVATDGAGNEATKQWTINVDPQGAVTVEEAEDTLEAVDVTSEAAIVAPTDEVTTPEERADGNNPELVEEGEFLEGIGTPTRSTISLDPEDGFTIELPEGDLHVEPESVGGGATDMNVAADGVAVAGNTSSHVDSIVRPLFNGITSFQSIRDKAGPEEYFWRVSLAPGQTLRQVSSKDAEVVYEDGVVALLIAAELAHDAVGADVPTALAVIDDDTIKLTVSHKQGTYVYPVVAGAGWEGGYTTEIVLGPKTEKEEEEERKRIEQEELELALQEGAEEEEEREAGAPGDEFNGQYDELYTTGPIRPRRLFVAVEPPEMWDAQQRIRRSAAKAKFCATISCTWWQARVRSTWFWNGKRGRVGGFAWRGNTPIVCETNTDVNPPWPLPDWDTDVLGIGWAGSNPAPYGYGQYLNLWCNFGVDWINATGPTTDEYQIQDHLYGSGYQGRHIKELPPKIIEN